jgi:hypothetical protein
MEALTIKSTERKVIITIDKSSVDEDFLAGLFDRLKIEQLLKKADFVEDVLQLSDEIKRDWWKKNKHNFIEETDDENSRPQFSN